VSDVKNDFDNGTATGFALGYAASASIKKGL